jgi:DNA helicase-2/ATP-dependent DNA helicase PcrA
MSPSELNKPQLEAVQHLEGPLAVIAIPGAGKTRVISYRTANLINRGIHPGRILVVTFTNKAANEIKERIVKLVPENLGKQLCAGTFHSVCARILRNFSEECKVPKDFVIYDASDQKSLVTRVIKELHLNKDEYDSREVARKINLAKQESLSTYELANRLEDPYDKIYEVYEKSLCKSKALDFTDLIFRVVVAISNPVNETFVKTLQDLWDYVLVDEFQDTNLIQFKLIHELCKVHNNICIVGDTDQSIYKFQGADFRNVLNFNKAFPGTKVIKLEQNYRSTKKILAVANSLINHNQVRQEKDLWTDNEEGDDIELWECSSDKEEAKKVVDLIKKQVSNDKIYNEIAILYRTHAQSRLFEDAFRVSNIPYKIVGGLRFYDRAEVKDILAYLRVLQNPDDDVSLLRIINNPPRKIGKSTTDKLEEISETNKISIWQALFQNFETFKGTKQEALFGFVELISKLQESFHNGGTPLTLVTSIIEDTGYKKLLKDANTIEADSKLENLGELLTSIRQLEMSGINTLGDYLEAVTLATDEEGVKKEQINYVTLMTMHAAKGLEFPVVIVVGMEEGLFPGSRREQTEWEQQAYIEEERRLAYVAITRAKQYLALSYAKERYLWGTRKIRVRSRFIDNIAGNLLKLIKSNRKYTDCFGYLPESSHHITPTEVSFQRQKPKETPKSRFCSGDKISHPKFGEGNILEVTQGTDCDNVKIKFSSGETKTISSKFLL